MRVSIGAQTVGCSSANFHVETGPHYEALSDALVERNTFSRSMLLALSAYLGVSVVLNMRRWVATVMGRPGGVACERWVLLLCSASLLGRDGHEACAVAVSELSSSLNTL